MRVRSGPRNRYELLEAYEIDLPHIRALIKRQRIALLQDVVRAVPTNEFSWHSVAKCALATITAPLGRSNDFLWANPRTKLVQDRLRNIRPWWRCVVRTWYDCNLPLAPSSLSAQEQHDLHIHAPLWLNRYDQWHYRTNDGIGLPTALIPSRSARTYTSRAQLASVCGIYCLSDVFNEEHGWPSANEFMQRVSTAFTAAAIETPDRRFLLFVHKQLTQLFRRVPAPPDDATTPTRRPVWPWVLRSGGRIQRFPLFRPKTIKRSLLPASLPRRRHPIERHGIRITSIVATTVSRTLRKFISPVYLDVCFRVWWRVLPAGYFCWGATNPALRSCTHGCSSLETYEHLFFSCSFSSSLWQLHYASWKQLFTRRPVWSDVLFGFDLPVESTVPVRGAQLLWNTLSCISIVYVLWVERQEAS